MRFLKEDFNNDYNKLKQEIKDVIRQSFSGLDDEDYNDLVGDYLVVEIDEINDFNAKVEVRAELSYNQLDKLANKLDPIIQKYDEEAYFDHEDAGIIFAYIKTDSYRKWKRDRNQGKFVYHGTKTPEIAKDIIENGFKADSIFFSEDQYDAQGYGFYLIKVKDIDKLNLYLIDDDEINKFNINDISNQVKNTREYDGIKYRYSKDRPYNYEIFDIANLNKLERFSD